MKIRQVKLDLLYEYILHNAPLSIQDCVKYYTDVCSSGTHISRGYKQLYVLRNKGLIAIRDKMINIQKRNKYE